nr:alpha-glucan water dikinase 1, chloroplastic-like isoform X2 [Tanacetum cinerariifolium]
SNTFNLIEFMPLKQKEFEEARKELQRELEKGTSLDDLRKKMTKGEIQTTEGVTQNKDQKQPAKKVYSTPERINRKKRDIMQFLKKLTPVTSKGTVSMKPKTLSSLQIFSKAIEEQTDADVLNKKIYRLGDKELLVLVTNASNKTRVHLATNVDGPFTLHWAISEKTREWLTPPENLLPLGSVSLD